MTWHDYKSGLMQNMIYQHINSLRPSDAYVRQ